MAERASALADLPPASREAALTLREVRPGTILQVAAWPGNPGAVRTVIGELLGFAAPQTGTASANPNATVAAVAPGRYLIAAAGPDLVARFEAALLSADGAVTDLSHGRVILRLEGAGAPALLCKAVALDLHPAAFPVGRVAQTTIEHIDVVIHRLSDTMFDLWVLRSFAESLAEWLLDAGLEEGIGFARS